MNEPIYKTDDICHWYKFHNEKCLMVKITFDGAGIEDYTHMINYAMKNQDCTKEVFDEKLDQAFNHLMSL